MDYSGFSSSARDTIIIINIVRVIFASSLCALGIKRESRKLEQRKPISRRKTDNSLKKIYYKKENKNISQKIKD